MLRPFNNFIFIIFLFFLLSPAAFASSSPMGQVSLSQQDRILVLAPHPDDEVLGAGGVIQQATAMKLPSKIVFLTYGDSNEWSFLVYRKHLVVMPKAVLTMGLVRHNEALHAAGILGLKPEDLIFLGYPDFGTLNIWYYHWNKRPPYVSLMTRVTAVPYAGAYRPGALYKGEEIVYDLRSILREFKPTKIFVSHPGDHNGDHLALYLYLQVALWDEGMENTVSLYPYVVHYLGWPQHKGLHPEMPLLPPQDIASIGVWKIFPLTQDQQQTNLRALEAHASQYRSSPKYLLSFIRGNELFADLSPVKVRLNENASIFPQQKKFVSPALLSGELNEREKLAFIGVDWKFVRWQKDNLVVSIKLSKPLARDVEASIYFFGYNNRTPFEQMPKINVRLGFLSYNVYDQNKRLAQSVIRVERRPNELTLSLPMELLGFPQKILTSARTSLGNFPLDTASWIVVELAP